MPATSYTLLTTHFEALLPTITDDHSVLLTTTHKLQHTTNDYELRTAKYALMPTTDDDRLPAAYELPTTNYR